MGHPLNKTGIGYAVRESIRVLNLDRLLRLFTQNKMVGSAIGKLVPENRQYPHGTTRNVTRRALNYSIDISDYQGWLIYYGFLDDRPEELFGLVKPGYNIVDIGANIGQTSMELSKLISPESHIWAFEPDPENYRRFSENLRLNAVSNITAVHAGLGSREHQASMMPKTANNRGGSSVQLTGTGNGVLVNITTLDKFIDERRCKINLIKIDVEGYEMEVLKGAEQSIRAQRPVLFIEVDDELLKAKGASPAGLIGWLQDLNYRVNKAGDKAQLQPGHDYTGCHFDVCAMPNQ